MNLAYAFKFSHVPLGIRVPQVRNRLCKRYLKHLSINDIKEKRNTQRTSSKNNLVMKNNFIAIQIVVRQQLLVF